MNKIFANFFLFLLMSVLLCGCSGTKNEIDKLRDMEFTVATEEELPEELKSNLEAQKEKEFKITYLDKDYLYICVGYGEQKTGGYSIKVNELYLAENAIYIDTNLYGPAEKEAKNEALSYPYVVVKTELLDKNVVFK